MNNKIIGQIIALTKNVWIVEPTSEKGFMAQFLAGKREPFSFVGGFGLTWWYTKTSFKLIENVSAMLVGSFEEFSGCDPESIGEIIKVTLTEICVDKRLFNIDDICFSRKNTLFDCKAQIDTNAFGSTILEELLQESGITSPGGAQLMSRHD